MKCSSCGTELVDGKTICPQCGMEMKAKDDMDTIIANILEEDDYKPKFEEVDPTKGTESQLKGNHTSDGPGKPTVVSKTRSQRTDKKGNGSKAISKISGYSKRKSTAKRSTGSYSRRKASQAGGEKSSKLMDQIVEGLRYGLVGVIVLYTISLFFTWFTLSGNGVNYGYDRNEASSTYLYKDIEGYSVESLDSYDGPIATFSAMDLYGFGRKATDPYRTIIGPSGAEGTSIVGVVHNYYMQFVMVMFLVNVASLALILLFRSLKGMAVVRNLSVVNFVIIGLNYMALKVPWFSMFAVKTKDLLKQVDGYHQVSTTMDGIAFDDRFYRYEMYHERGFVFAMAMLILWLLISIVLAEVKSRRDEIAIEKGEI